MEKTGVREISRRTGYSPATVSNVLNGKPGVSRKAIDAVLTAANEMGLHAKGPLRSITFVLARKSGYVLDQGDFHPIVVEGVRAQAESQGFQVDYATVELNVPDGGQAQVEELFADPTRAVILCATEMSEVDYRPFDAYDDRIVVVDGWSDAHSYESVVTDNETAAYQAVRYLYQRGHRRIGYLAGTPRLRNYGRRERGVRRALRDLDVPYTDAFRAQLRPKIEDARLDMLSWLRAAHELPTAFFADCDALAVGAVRALVERGVSVPGDVSIIGFDGTLASNFSNPALTTVYVPKAEIGKLAVTRLVEGLARPREFAHTTLMGTSIAERGSVRTMGDLR